LQNHVVADQGRKLYGRISPKLNNNSSRNKQTTDKDIFNFIHC
jgi:hypothetical protein